MSEEKEQAAPANGAQDKSAQDKSAQDERAEDHGAAEAARDATAEAPALTALLRETFPGDVLRHHHQHGDETVTIRREGMLPLLSFLKTDPRCAFEMMMDLTAVDYLPRRPRFEVVIHLKSITLNHRLRVKVPVTEEAAEVDSIRALWIAADWYERECHEMYGIQFKGHPNLAPLLLYEGFQGHPLRKDYAKEHMQPLVPLRPVRERYDYGETFHPVSAAPPSDGSGAPESAPSGKEN